MPRDRYRLEMEAVLAAEELVTLSAFCRAFDVKPDRWHEVPSIARAFEVLAVTRIADQLVEERGMKRGWALDLAASRCGVKAETIRSRQKVA